MKSKVLYDQQGERIFAVIFDANDEVMAGLREFARQQNLTAAHFTAIGAFRDVTLAYFDPDRREYQHIPVREQVEVLSLVGNVSVHEEGPKVHAHVVIGKRDGTAHGGHLIEAHVRPTLEVTLEETPRHLLRRHDEATGLLLIEV